MVVVAIPVKPFLWFSCWAESMLCHRLHACPVALAILVALDSQFDQAIQQLCVAQAAGFPELGIHADLGKAGHGVNLVDVDLARLFLEEEIDAREAAEVERGKSLDGLSADHLGGFLGNIGRDDSL